MEQNKLNINNKIDEYEILITSSEQFNTCRGYYHCDDYVKFRLVLLTTLVAVLINDVQFHQIRHFQ